jgi:hypothetical protein
MVHGVHGDGGFRLHNPGPARLRAPLLTDLLAATGLSPIRPDKPGQTRVFASDGSEFTGADALWMKWQLRSVLQECAQGDEGKADATLRGVNELLRAHRRST